jgi:hypothetical protein
MEARMHRRKFLKLLGLASIAATARLPLLAGFAAAAMKTVSYGGRLYRSDGSGKVYVSTNGGTKWALQTDLGRSYSVTKLAVDRSNRLNASVGFASWSFGLVLAPDLNSWRTA